ncbi:MAG: hypothetical protein HY791_02995 [Deltaproteobacteria bacterium]|nr:hypothetical protein [Deltaproteobacteria bacterium]
MNKTESTFQLYCALIQSSDLGRGGTAAEKPERFAGIVKQAQLAADVFETQVGVDEETRMRRLDGQRRELENLESTRSGAIEALRKAELAEQRAKAAEQRAKDALFELEKRREDAPVERREG